MQAFQEECARDLEAAEPIIADAEAALNSLDKASLGELKSFGSPAQEVVNVVSACMVLTAPGGKVPKDLSWPAGKKVGEGAGEMGVMRASRQEAKQGAGERARQHMRVILR